MKVQSVLGAVAGAAAHPPQERKFWVSFDHLYSGRVQGTLSVRLCTPQQGYGDGHEYNAIAVTLLDTDKPVSMGIFVWRTNWLCCERCGPTLGQTERATIELLDSGGLATVAWQPYRPSHTFADAELRAAIDTAAAEGCQQLDRWCRFGGEHN